MSNETPLISVIMLTYNREVFVARAIESILNQTYKNVEFIIVDNGSSDNSGNICDEYALKDSRIKVIHKSKGNIGSGRNAGLNSASGEYIAFIDDDDWCESDFLDFLYKLAADNNADISICGANDKDYDEKCVMTNTEALIRLFWRKRYNVQFPTKMLKTKMFDNVRFSESAVYDDIELMPRIISRANKIAYHGLSKYTFYRHESNNSAWTSNHKLLNASTLDEYLNVYFKRTEWLCESFPEKAEEWRYFEWSFMISMVEKIDRLQIQGCEKQMRDMLQELSEHKDEFLSCRYLNDFEREWIVKYV